MKSLGKILIILLISFLGLLIPASLMGAAAYFLGKNVLGWFFTTGAVTAVIGWLWNMTLELKSRNLRDAIDAQNKLADAYQNVETSCTYCNTRNIIRVALGKDNNYTCKNCNNVNNVHIEFTTSRKTTAVIADEVLNDVFTKLDAEPNPQKQSTVNSGKITITKGADTNGK